MLRRLLEILMGLLDHFRRTPASGAVVDPSAPLALPDWRELARQAGDELLGELAAARPTPEEADVIRRAMETLVWGRLKLAVSEDAGERARAEGRMAAAEARLTRLAIATRVDLQSRAAATAEKYGRMAKDLAWSALAKLIDLAL